MTDVLADVSKKGRTLLLEEPFYGHFLMSINKEIIPRIETACVFIKDWNTILGINPQFWSTLQDGAKVGVLKHELLHVAFGHLFMSGTERFPDRELFNVAADLEINQYINDKYKDSTWLGLCIHASPFKELNLPKNAGTIEYYKLLKQEIEQNPDGDISKIVNALKEANGTSGPSMEVTLGDGSTIRIPISHELWKDIENMSDSEKKLIKSQIEHKLQEVANEVVRGRGTIPGEIKDIITLIQDQYKAVLDWKAFLRRFAGLGNKTYLKDSRRKLNKRFVDSPGVKIKRKQLILIAIDTSGSVSNTDLEELFGQIHHIWKTGAEIDIVQCDTQITDVRSYKGKSSEFEVKGRGGTDFNPVMEYLSKNRNKYQNLIYLTDGEAPAPDTKPVRPVLWLHCSTSKINDTLPGTKIQITNKESK